MGALEVEDGTRVQDSPQDTQEQDLNGEDLKKGYSMEGSFKSAAVPVWWKQITIRGLVVSAVLGVLFSVITLKLSLTVGIIPSLNVSAGLLGFFFIKSYTKVLSKLNISHVPFTRQENTVIQTCVVACYGLAFSGGFGSYLTGLDTKTYNQVHGKSAGAYDSASDIKDPELRWIIAYMFAVGFLGLLAVVPIRKVMIIDYKLTYPSGTATGVLINSFHTPHGYKEAVKQIFYMGKYFAISFFFGLFKWFFSGPQDLCGFDNFPSLGLTAHKNLFYFDFSMTYVGAGMICPHLINVSLLLGGILSWGLMWPLIAKKAGDWYPADAAVGSNLQGLYGYKVFIATALILGDGLYNFVKISSITIWSLYQNRQKRLPEKNDDGLVYPCDLSMFPFFFEITVQYSESHYWYNVFWSAHVTAMENVSYDDQRRTTVFMKDRIPVKIAAACYAVLAIVSTIVVPHIFHKVKWYYIFLSYILAPVLGFCNAYGMGLTDWSLASTYGKLSLFIFSAWAGSDGGVLVGLVSCGVMMVVVACSADLMQDFKTGYLTLSSPRSMFASQVLGTFMGCIIAPLTFWLFWKAFDVGNPNGEYKVPYAIIFREMATIGVQGFGALPKHCLELCYAFFCIAIVVNFLRDKPLKKWAGYIPIPMAMAIPFYLGPYFAIDMFVGTVVVYVWQKLNMRKATLLVPAVASGLICGDGVWTLISAVLALAKKQPPICMYFLASKGMDKYGLPEF